LLRSMPRPAGYQLCRRWSHSQAATGNNKQYGVYYTTWCELNVIFEGAVATDRHVPRGKTQYGVHFNHVLRAGYLRATTSLNGKGKPIYDVLYTKWCEPDTPVCRRLQELRITKMASVTPRNAGG
jgi:hypothetical protein